MHGHEVAAHPPVVVDTEPDTQKSIPTPPAPTTFTHSILVADSVTWFVPGTLLDGLDSSPTAFGPTGAQFTKLLQPPATLTDTVLVLVIVPVGGLTELPLVRQLIV